MSCHGGRKRQNGLLERKEVQAAVLMPLAQFDNVLANGLRAVVYQTSSRECRGRLESGRPPGSWM